MDSIAKFYTFFWIVYFPTCLTFQYKLGYDWIDELLCVILVGFAILNRSKMRIKKRYKQEFSFLVCFFVLYTIYSLLIHVTTFRGIYLDLLQQIRPYSVFYLTLFLAPHFTVKQKKLIVYSLLVSMLLYFGGGRYVGYQNGHEEDGVLPMVALTCGMMYYLFMRSTKRNLYISIVLILLGLLSGKSKYFGQCITFIGIVLFLKDSLNFKSVKFYLSVTALVSIIMYFTWTKFSSYYVEGFLKDNTAEMVARPASYSTAGQILIDYFPFGSGLGSFCTAAAAKEYSPLYYKYGLNKIWGMSPDFNSFIADCYYPGLAEFGVVGIFFFLFFWKRRIVEINKINCLNYYQMGLMVVCALAIDSSANTAYLSGVGMGLFMTLAICLNSDMYLKEDIESDDYKKNNTVRRKKMIMIGLNFKINKVLRR